MLWPANSYLVLKRQLNGQVRLLQHHYYQPAFSDFCGFSPAEQASVL